MINGLMGHLRNGGIMSFKKLGIVVLAGLILVIGHVVSSPAASSKYAAKVNGIGIKTVVLDTAVRNFIENQKAAGVELKEGDEERLRKDILQELISAEILYQASKKAKLGDFKKIIEEHYKNFKQGFGTEKEFKALLKDKGISEKDLKEDVKRGIYIKALVESQIYSGISVAEQEKRDEYEKRKDQLNIPDGVKASHILIRVEPDASDEVKKGAMEKIEELRRQAISGGDFAELARDNSEDGSASRGGDLGYFKRGMMVKPFEDTAFALEKGQISKVVETQFGYHIIKLTDKQSARTLTFEEVEGDVGNFLLNTRRIEALNKFVEERRSKAKIEILID